MCIRDRHYTSKTLEFCFTHTNSRYGETVYSFVNGQYTSDGGTHLSAFREGVLKAINEYAKGKYEGDDVREELLHFFNRNKDIAEKIIAKAQDTQQLRKELQEVKKLARERAKAITLHIPQLKDCK